MNFRDLNRLDAGDSIIGLGGRWDDELPIVNVGPVRFRRGREVRAVIARCSAGRGLVAGEVFADDDTIRGRRTWGLE